VATKTLGSNATTTLTAVQMPSAYAGLALSDADIATIANSILDDQAQSRVKGQSQLLASRIYPGAFSRAGLLYVPNRGVLKVLPGDWVAVDPAGWPVLISGASIPQTLTATGTPIDTTAPMTMTTNVLTKGWNAGMALSGTGIQAGTVIEAISPDGLTVTLSKVANASPGPTTITASSWTHS